MNSFLKILGTAIGITAVVALIILDRFVAWLMAPEIEEREMARLLDEQEGLVEPEPKRSWSVTIHGFLFPPRRRPSRLFSLFARAY